MLLRAIFILAAVMLPTACTAKSESPDDPDAAAFLAENPGLTKECAAKARTNIMAVMLADVPDCYVLTPPKRWVGLLNRGWEWSNFCPAPATSCGMGSDRGAVWTEFGQGAHDGPDIEDGIYAIEFIGRRTQASGHYGHLGRYEYQMTVDRVISVRKLDGGSKK